MSEKITVGFKETKEVLNFVIPLVKAGDTALEDGKIQLTELVLFIPALLKFKDAIEGVDQVPFEFKLATAEEANELKAYLKAELDLRDDQMEQFIEDAFGVVLDIWQLIKTYTFKGGEPIGTEAGTPSE